MAYAEVDTAAAHAPEEHLFHILGRGNALRFEHRDRFLHTVVVELFVWHVFVQDAETRLPSKRCVDLSRPQRPSAYNTWPRASCLESGETVMIRKVLSIVVVPVMLAVTAPGASANVSPGNSLTADIQQIVTHDVAVTNLSVGRGGTNGYYDKPIHEVGHVQCVQIAPLSKWANFVCTFTIADFDGGITVTYRYKFHAEAGGWAATSLPFAPFSIW